MKWMVALSVAMLFTLRATSQYDYFVYENGVFQSEMSVYVYAEQATLKARATADGKDLVSLVHGDRLVVVYNANVEHERNGIIHTWYNVTYTNDSGRAITGFIPGNDLALGAITFQIDYQRDLLLFRLKAFNAAMAYTLEAKVVRNGQLIKELETPFIDFHLNPARFSYSVSVLKNIQTRIDDKSEVAEITFYHMQQDLPSGTLYLIWNGEHLDRICETMYIHEPFVFIYDSWVIYPGREGVLPGTIKQVEVIHEYDEEKEDYIVVEKIETLYTWDGKRISKLAN